MLTNLIEYITQLESEIAAKVTENGELKSQNRALVDENKRLQELTRMLLSSSSFSGFLDNLSTNPNTLPQPNQQIKTEEPQQQQAQQQRQLPKDVNAFGAQPTQQQIGMAMIPEQNMDFSMLSLDTGFSFQPQVFVVDTPEIPTSIDTSVLSGKSSNFVEQTFESEEKIEAPVIEHPVESVEALTNTDVDEEFEADPDFALFHSEPCAAHNSAKESELETMPHIDIFGGLDSAKVLSRYELVDATEEECTAALAIARVHRLTAHAESALAKLELLTINM